MQLRFVDDALYGRFTRLKDHKRSAANASAAQITVRWPIAALVAAHAQSTLKVPPLPLI